jgi:hypothetical protein
MIHGPSLDTRLGYSPSKGGAALWRGGGVVAACWSGGVAVWCVAGVAAWRGWWCGGVIVWHCGCVDGGDGGVIVRQNEDGLGEQGLLVDRHGTRNTGQGTGDRGITPSVESR